MKLLIHVGTEKTGSSHIQTLCVTGRAQLQSNQIWFPEGIPKHEKRMRAGLVSAGNGFRLAELMRQGKDADVEAELARHVQAARGAECKVVFLTSELLLPYCAGPLTWRRLLESCAKVGFESVSILVVLRDPVDQLISLYKHRARSGTAGQIAEWVTDGYHLPQDLAVLREELASSGAELIARGYTRRPGGLESIFFNDLLGIHPPTQSIDGEINPSLSLSELELLRLMNARSPALVPFLQQRLGALPRKAKVQGSAIEGYTLEVARGALWQHREEWQRWNEVLPKSERLTMPDTRPQCTARPDEFGFSSRQLDELDAFIADTASFSFSAKLFWRAQIRPFLGWVKGLVVAK